MQANYQYKTPGILSSFIKISKIEGKIMNTEEITLDPETWDISGCKYGYNPFVINPVSYKQY